ncbi:MAG: IPT/TIG domain-containing protein [Chloroflexi bacterium]|nr:IPT/TIG domain-containing protein [Chloroflexota bacterium]
MSMKCDKVFRILAVALFLAFLVAIVPVTPAQAAGNLRVSPNRGKIGDNVEVYGSDFDSSFKYDVYFSRERAPVDDRINTNVLNYKFVGTTPFPNPLGGTFVGIFFNIPVDLRDGKTVEKVRGGTYYVYTTILGDESKRIRARAEFTVEGVPAITLTLLEGAVGAEVKIGGMDFSANSSIVIKFDGAQVKTVTSDGNGDFSNVALTVPESYRGNHTVEVRDASDKLATATFTTKQAITVTPTSGAAGDNITVSGTGFAATKGITVSFDNKQLGVATTNSLGSFGTVIFAAPAQDAGSYNIVVADENGNSASLGFTIVGAALNLNPTTAESGTEVMVTGSGFRVSRLITITFNNSTIATATSDNSGAFTASFKVPVLAATTYKVEASDGTNNAEADFSIATSAGISPATSAASPGHVGMQLTVSGSGFAAGGMVTVSYDGKPIATAPVSSDGKFSAIFEVSPSSGGGHSIVATDGVVTKQFAFIMESTSPPTPKPLKPEMGIKAERETYFDWEDVADSSGVTYTLQIATDKDFPSGSIVLEKTGITRSEYTITGRERLKSVSKEAPYYWHVRAVDGTSSESQWSGTGEFSVGFSWGLSQKATNILLGIGALLLAAFFFWLGRRTAYF